MTKVFISGCFDLFHVGHLECLEFAKSQGDYLVVSVASDETVRTLKREPVFSESERLQIIRGLKCVDEAFIARGETTNWDFLPYLDAVKPNVWVISWDDKLAEEKQLLADKKEIILVQRVRPAQTPTTGSLLEKIRRV